MSNENKNFINQWFKYFLSCILLTSCASTEERPELGTDINYRGSDCISIRTIRDYEPLDKRSLLMKAGGNRVYLVTLASSSFELRSSYRLGFKSRDTWLCPYGGDRIVFSGLSNLGFPIRAISKVTSEQAEDLLIRYGRKAPPLQKDPAPPEVKGAEVEELG